MKKKRIEQNEIKRYFLIIAAFLSFMILSLLFFLSWLQQLAVEKLWQQM